MHVWRGEQHVVVIPEDVCRSAEQMKERRRGAERTEVRPWYS